MAHNLNRWIVRSLIHSTFRLRNAKLIRIMLLFNVSLKIFFGATSKFTPRTRISIFQLTLPPHVRLQVVIVLKRLLANVAGHISGLHMSSPNVPPNARQFKRLKIAQSTFSPVTVDKNDVQTDFIAFVLLRIFALSVGLPAHGTTQLVLVLGVVQQGRVVGRAKVAQLTAELAVHQYGVFVHYYQRWTLEKYKDTNREQHCTLEVRTVPAIHNPHTCNS